MKKNCWRGVTTGAGLCLVLSQFSFAIQPMQAQISAPIRCRNIVQADLEERSRRLESQAFDAIDRGRFSEAIQALNQLIQVASKMTNEREKSLIIERAIEGNNFQESRLGRLVRRAESSQRSQAISFLEKFQQLTQRLSIGYSFNKANGLRSIAMAYRELGRNDRAIAAVSQALQATQFIRGAEFQTKTLTPIAQEYLALGRTTEAGKILNQSFRFAQQVRMIEPFSKSLILEPIASTYAKLGKIDQALKIAQTVPTDYYRSIAQAEVVRTYLRTNQIEEAQQLAQKLENAEIKSKTLGEIAIYFVEAGQINRGNQVFQQALQATKDPNLTDFHRSQLIQSYAKAGQREVALQAAIALTETEQKAIALGTIAIESSKAKQTQEVDRILSLIAPLIQQANAYDPVGFLPSLIDTALQEKQFKLAYDFVRNVQDGQSEFVFRVATAIINAGEVGLALQIVRSMDRGWVDYRSQSFVKIAAIYAQRNQTDQALKLVEETENAGSSPYRVLALTQIAASTTNRVEADKIFQSAIAQADQLDSPLFKAQAYGFISRASISANKIDQGEKYLKLAIDTAKQEKDPQSLSFNLRTIADYFIQAEQFLVALEVAKAIPEEGERTSKIGEIFGILLRRDELDKAGSLVTEFKSPETQARSLITLAQAWLENNQRERAKLLLTTAFQVTQTVPDPEVRKIPIREDLEVEDDNDRASLLEAIARLYAQVGEVNAALQVAQKIQDPKIREPLRQQIRCYR